MKTTGLLAFLLSLATSGFGQQIEYSVHLNSGLFRFGGQSATRTSALALASGRAENNYTLNPYGKNFGLSYGAAAQLQKITSRNLIMGLQAGFETLRSKVKLTHAYALISSSTAPEASGKTIFRHDFVNAYPFFGKRFWLNRINLDMRAGPDLGYCLKSHEKGAATDKSGQTYHSDRERNKPGLDTRARLEISAYYHHVGLTAGYSYGLKNYTPNTEGANSRNFARLLRFGLTYLI